MSDSSTSALSPSEGVLEDESIGEDEPEAAASKRAARRKLSSRLALGVFVAYLIAAVPLIILVLGDFYWFLADDWAIIIDYQAWDPSDLFEARAGHWVTLPILLYRALWNLVGLNYWVYQLALVLTHLTSVVLLRVMMRRVGVAPWTATITASILVLFGSGEPNIIWAFLIEFVGAFAFGLTQLLLSDHDGRIDRRDWLGLGAGVLALMCSGVGVTMAVVVGVATFLRRGWRVALFHVVPLAVVYVSWWLITDPLQLGQPDAGIVTRLRKMAEWFFEGFTGAFEAIGQIPGVGLALGVVLIVGLYLAWSPMTLAEFRQRASLPAAMLAGAFVYVGMTGWTRWHFGIDQAATSRYVYFIVGFLLPPLAVAADALIRRWRVVTPVVYVLLLAGIPGNIDAFGTDFPWVEPFMRNQRRFIETLPYAPEARQVSPDVRPSPVFNDAITIGWLLEQADKGRFSPPDQIDPRTANTMRLVLGLSQRLALGGEDCPKLEGPITVRPPIGSRFLTSGASVVVELLEDGRPTGTQTAFSGEFGQELRVELPDLELQFSPGQPNAGLSFTGLPRNETLLCVPD
jgi:hypothetical protein